MARKKPTRTKKRTNEFVLDGSVTLAWFFEDESDAYADSVQDSLAKAAAFVPTLWHLEIANALLAGERKKRTTEAKATKFLTLVAALPITADDQTAARAWDETINLARSHALSSYDAAYLELALRKGLPLATLDKPLRAAMRTVGIPLYLTD
jgi:predicted nucleic acid-binding protein